MVIFKTETAKFVRDDNDWYSVKSSLPELGRPAILMCFVPACIEMIGTIPMAMGLKCGEIVLTVAVVSILLTAPFGAVCIDILYKKLLLK